jgi:hypothetical protein
MTLRCNDDYFKKTGVLVDIPTAGGGTITKVNFCHEKWVDYWMCQLPDGVESFAWWVIGYLMHLAQCEGLCDCGEQECGKSLCGVECGECAEGQMCSPAGNCYDEEDAAIAPYLDIFYSPKVQEALYAPIGGWQNGDDSPFNGYSLPNAQEVDQLKVFLNALVDNGETNADPLFLPADHPDLGTPAFASFKDRGWLTWDEARHLWIANLAVTLYLEGRGLFGWSILDDIFDKTERRQLLAFNLTFWSSPSVENDSAMWSKDEHFYYPCFDAATGTWVEVKPDGWVDVKKSGAFYPICYSPDASFPYGVGPGWVALRSWPYELSDPSSVGNANIYSEGSALAGLVWDYAADTACKMDYFPFAPGVWSTSSNPAFWDEPSLACGGGECSDCETWDQVREKLVASGEAVDPYINVKAALETKFSTWVLVPQTYYSWNPIVDRFKICRMIAASVPSLKEPNQVADSVLDFIRDRFRHEGGLEYAGEPYTTGEMLDKALGLVGLLDEKNELLTKGGYIVGFDSFDSRSSNLSSVLTPFTDDGKFPPGWGVFEEATVTVKVPYGGCKSGAGLGVAFLSSMNIPAGVFSSGVFGGQEPYYKRVGGHGGIAFLGRTIEHFDDVVGRYVSARALGAPKELVEGFRQALDADWVEQSTFGFPLVGSTLKPIPGTLDEFGPNSSMFWPAHYAELHHATDINALVGWFDSGGVEGIWYPDKGNRYKSWNKLRTLYECWTKANIAGPWGPCLVMPPLKDALAESLSPGLLLVKQLLEADAVFETPKQYWMTLGPVNCAEHEEWLPVPPKHW